MINDNNSIKHGTYASGPKIEIDSFDREYKNVPGKISLMARNFYGELKESLQQMFRWSGTLIVSLPSEIQTKRI